MSYDSEEHRTSAKSTREAQQGTRRLLSLQNILVALAVILVGYFAVSYMFPQVGSGPQQRVVAPGTETPGRDVTVEIVFQGERHVIVDGVIIGEFANGATLKLRPGLHAVGLSKGGPIREATSDSWQTVTIHPGAENRVVFPQSSSD